MKNYESLGVITNIVNRLFLISIFTWQTIFTVYIYSISTEKENQELFDTKNVLFRVLTVFFAVSSVLLIVLPLEFYNKDNVVYSYGLSANLLYAIVVIYFISWIVLFFKNKNKTYKKKYSPILVLILIMAIALYIRAIDPGFLIISSSFAIVTNFMYFTIENPDIKMVEQLQLAREQADKANRAKTDFLSSMSHEIRTPLNAINGFSNMIAESKTLEEAKSNAKDIVNASDTLLEIVNGVLDISKIESGKLEIIESPYNAKEIFEDLARLITPRMNEKGLDFSYYIAPDLPDTLYGDHANIKKIVTNFLSNACKYTEKGFVRYEVNCINTHNKCKLVISVEDSGRGIKKDKIDKLFTKFDRLDVERNTTVEGTGLGLAITKQLVELMGGKIIVHTIYGEGSKFTVMLDQKVEETKLVKKKEKHTEINLGNTKILIVDDNNLNLKVATKMLEKYGAKDITPARSGYECIDLVKENTYDIILLDDMMPKMTGTETLAELRKDPSFNTPVIALTANAISGMREKYLEQGFDEYLAKPIEKEEFTKVLEKVLFKDESSVTEEVTDEGESEMEEENVEEEVVEEPQSVEEPPEVDGEAFLRSRGVDMDKALEALGDMEMYNETFKDFAAEVESKWSKLEEEKLAGDMENFAIDVHALKSDCKYLGFYNLADVAYEHELKSKENDKDFVDQNFNRLETEYEKVLNIVNEYKDRI
ncbi:MAG: response regulator [Bacilli bacterium]|nr:response regulator [Bacilli bacterium]